MAVIFHEGDVVLFQGDSITDCQRIRENPDDLGRGYAMMAAAWFSATHPELKVHFLNRGISGNRVRDLASRWQEDCLDLKPSWVSILIGINDVWRRYDSADPTPAEDYYASYRDILERAKQACNARFILLEPFVLPYPEDRMSWRVDLDPKIQAVRRLAQEFHAILVPLDGIFAQAVSLREPTFWSGDGVHPTPAGHALIARAWLHAVRAL